MNRQDQNPTSTPSRRNLLIAGAVLGGASVAGAVVAGTRRSIDHDSEPVETTTPPATRPARPSITWTERDPRLLESLKPSGDVRQVTRTHHDVFPSLKVREILPLAGTGDGVSSWVAATIIGKSHQLQIAAADETSPRIVLDIPLDPPAEILSMAWDQDRKVLYLSAGGNLYRWRLAAPNNIEHVADVPGATSLYELLVDPDGAVWGGTFPTGTVFRYSPASREARAFTQFASDSDYVRRLSMDARGRMWIGTGALNPRIFTFHRTTPESRVEIPIPEPLDSGFITAIRAGATKVRVTTDGHPDVFELDSKVRTWDRSFREHGWVRTPSSELLEDDTYYMAQDGELFAHGASGRRHVTSISDSTPRAVHLRDSELLISQGADDGAELALIPRSPSGSRRARTVLLEPGRFRVQSILAPADGTLYAGGFMGSGIVGIDPDTGDRWQSPGTVDVIDQVESMIGVEPDHLYLGTYSWADIISCDLSDRDSGSSYTRIARYSEEYDQSRPYGLASNSTSLFVGTVPDYGRSGGVLARIDRASNSTSWVMHGEGDGFIAGHSIIGLVASENFVYGTTSVRNGSGARDTEGPACVFKLDIATRRVLWRTPPVPDTGALYSPHLVAGWLVIADLEGLAIVDPRDGELVARHELGPVANSSQRPGWASADLAVVDGGRFIAHAAGGFVTVADFLTGEFSEVQDGSSADVFGSRVTASPAGRLFVPARGTNIAEVGL